MFKCVYRYQFQVCRGTFSKESSPAFYLWGQLPLSAEYWLILESLHLFVSWPVLKGEVQLHFHTCSTKTKTTFYWEPGSSTPGFKFTPLQNIVVFWGSSRAVERFASEIAELMIIFVSLSCTNSSNQNQSFSASFALLMCQ